MLTNVRMQQVKKERNLRQLGGANAATLRRFVSKHFTFRRAAVLPMILAACCWIFPNFLCQTDVNRPLVAHYT